MSRKPVKRNPPSDPEPEIGDMSPEETDDANGTALATETEPVETSEEPAQVELKIKGSDRSARAAAKRFGGDPAKTVVTTPVEESEQPPEDPVAVLLSDGRNMVLVTRQKPRTIEAQDGSEFPTNVRIPGSYTCPTSKAEIEELVFNQHGGSKYKCTIHPDTSDGANKILGHFTIEHSNPKCPPFIDGVTVNVPEPDRQEIPGSTDPTMRETDNLADVKARLARRLDRAQTMKEIREMEKLAKAAEQDLDNDGKPPAPPAPVGESDELRKLREKNAELEKALSEKKVNDRFDKLEDSIAKLATAVVTGATAKPVSGGEDSIVLKMLNQSQQHAKDMVELMRDKAKPTAPSAEGDLDKFLDRVTKLQTITGSAPGNKSGTRLSELENRLIDMSFDRLTGGGEEADPDADTDDVAKLAVKQFAPILKTFVEKKMDQTNAENGGTPLTKEQIQRVYAEAAQAASKKVVEDLAAQGIHLGQAPDGRLVALQPPKPGTKTPVTPRQLGSRVVSEQRTSGGVVKKIAIEPADLSEKAKTHATAPTAAEPSKGDDANMAKCGEFPMLGDGGVTLKIPFPVRPGDLKYDRKYAVNFVLDGIRSEIRQGLPQKAATDQRIESYVIGDAIEYLDDEILDRILAIDSGPQLEALLAPWGDAPKIAEIKKSGDDETVASYLRKLVLSIQREWEREKSAPSSGN